MSPSSTAEPSLVGSVKLEGFVVIRRNKGELTPTGVLIAHVPVESTPFGEPVSAHVRYLIADAVEGMGHRASDVAVTSIESIQRLKETDRGALVLNLCYGIKASGGGPAATQPEIAGVFEQAGFDLVGAGHKGQQSCQDKLLGGQLAESVGVESPKIFEMNEIEDCVGPFLVKPRSGAAHRGIRIVADVKQLRESPPEDGDMIQEYLDGPEYTIGVINDPLSGPYALPLVRVRYKREFDKPATYQWSTTTMAPDSQNRFGLASKALALFDLYGLQDYARFDFRAVRGRGPVLMDANALPNLAPRQLLATSARWAGMQYPEFVAQLVDSALSRSTPTPSTPTR